MTEINEQSANLQRTAAEPDAREEKSVLASAWNACRDWANKPATRGFAIGAAVLTALVLTRRQRSPMLWD